MTSTTPDPDEATEETIAEQFEGLPIRYHPDGVCGRCSEKNSLRLQYTDATLTELPDESLDEGERICFTAGYDDSPLFEGLNWPPRKLFHERHPHKPNENIPTQGVAQVRGWATLVRAENAPSVRRVAGDEHAYEDELVLSDVEIELYSPPSQGEESTQPEQEGTVIMDSVTDRPDWPKEENEWRRQLILENEDPDC